MVRFEILLPLYYNDGRQVEPEKFTATDDDLVGRFGSTSTDTVVVRGKWKYESTLYSDQLIRIRIDVDDFPERWGAVRRRGQNQRPVERWRATPATCLPGAGRPAWPQRAATTPPPSGSTRIQSR